MKAREFLKELERKDNAIKNKLDELAELHSRYGINGGLSTDERVQTSLKADKMSDLIGKVIDLENVIDILTDDYADYKKHATKLIYMIDKPIYRDILYDRYILRHTITQVSFDLGKKKQTIKNYTDFALEELQKILDVDEIQ